jgi:hypothetical protein
MADAPGVNVRLLVVVVLAALNAAVTPLGIPATVNATLLLSPTGLLTLIVVTTLLVRIRGLRLLAEAARVKLGTGIVTLRIVELEAVAEVPLTVTA